MRQELFDPNQSFSREEMDKGRQRAVLITIDYEGYGYIEDGERFRGRAIVIHAPDNFHFGYGGTDVARIDREISRQTIERGVDPERIKDHEFNQMESALLRAVREKASAHGPEVTLIPIYEYRAMEKRIKELEADPNWQNTDNRHLAHQSMTARNDALRWKALATRLRAQRDRAQRSMFRRLFDRFRR